MATVVLNAIAIYKPLGFARYTNISSAISLASTAPASGVALPVGANFCLIQVETQNVRWRDDGTSPTSTVGQLFYAGADVFPYAGDLSAIQFIEATASASLTVSYYQKSIR